MTTILDLDGTEKTKYINWINGMATQNIQKLV